MENYPGFEHHGATQGVTGSCHRYLAAPDLHFLIDCGLFQGRDAIGDTLDIHRIEFDISAVRALLVTHVHIDHIGRLPYLLAAGFNGPIYCSEPSARLLPLVIEDALKVGFTRDAALIRRFLDTVDKQLVALPYRQWHTVAETDDASVRIRLQRAGHILGSAYIEIESCYKADDWRHRTVYSGDLGAPHAPLLHAPESPEYADTLVIESTYGNRVHENRETRRQRLHSVLSHALQNRGTVMIPAFSIGRTQELLYELEGLIYQGRHNGDSGWADLQVIVDSPLAARFTTVYRELKPFWDDEAQDTLRAGRHPLDFDSLYTVDSHEEHLQTVAYLAKTRQPAVVIAASGMAAGGRIVNYLKAMLPDPVHDVLFVGYQARGTLGYQLQQLPAGSEASVEIDGERVKVACPITSIGGYSAHADQQDLLNFVAGMQAWPQQIRLVHGESRARETLKAAFQAMAAEAGRELEVVVPT
ncbi:MBL fold metallo-hydrolase RNA specificity domain-containing protein [Pseudohongiella sp.]|uniref:Metallo-beta-lactamase domain-containing protein n=1 Tax=marine sediment metagenome TaxID=412755 RepID=A0A0F9W3I4_9ZZZZ|nr:MBL fold metallo-hydrolase [Pseudohongiella sp.]HDZ08966.1 MBL fold metallo-hydrolase [Pseudohongiella sp.]HEA62651.1 MBL fold metallo-hydrolase [Pseudohongiella sp.]